MKWSYPEELKLRYMYPFRTNKELSIMFGRSYLSIKRKGQAMGLKKVINPSHLTSGYCPVKILGNSKASRIKSAKTKAKTRKLKEFMLEYGIKINI